MDHDVSEVWEFQTPRLSVGHWHEVADRLGVDLASVVAELLTVQTTVALPESWQGAQTAESAKGWISDRDGDASMLLITESHSQQPVGLLVLAELPLPDSGVDLRVGYLFAERAWGQGLATELVSGLIDWARIKSSVRTLSGGVDLANGASSRVLEKCGFRLVDDSVPGVGFYQLEISPLSG